MMVELISSQKAELFKLLDNYSRTRHQCFLAEIFLDDAKTKYWLCFRPVGERLDSTDQYACSYVQIGLSAAGNASDKNFLDESLTELLDSKLSQLR